jgi:hypothetical protein
MTFAPAAAARNIKNAAADIHKSCRPTALPIVGTGAARREAFGFPKAMTGRSVKKL